MFIEGAVLVDGRFLFGAAVVGLVASLLVYLAVRAIVWLRVRLTHRRAAALLRRQRGTGNGDAAWRLRDWEWAYTRLGTRVGFDEAARCRMLQDRDSRGPGKATT